MKHERTKRVSNIKAIRQLPDHHIKVMGDAIYALIATRPDDETAFAAVQLLDDVRAAEKENAEAASAIRREQVAYLVRTS